MAEAVFELPIVGFKEDMIDYMTKNSAV